MDSLLPEHRVLVKLQELNVKPLAGDNNSGNPTNQIPLKSQRESDLTITITTFHWINRN